MALGAPRARVADGAAHAAVSERALEGVFWLALGVAVLIGTLAFLSAGWRPLTKLVVTVVYVPLMGIAVLISSVLTACGVHGCH